VSTIERAAELLRSVSQTRQKPSTASEGAGNLEQDLIERAAGDISRRRDSSEDKSAPPTGRATRTLEVDRDRLRQQSMITPDGERTAIAESFRRIKQQILANVASPRTGAPRANLVLVTSALAGEGKTFCAINLAISIALEMDRTVLLVDADVAKPGVPQALGLEAEKGLMDVLLDHRVDLAEVLWKTDIGRLTLLPAGRAHKHATELLASDAMRGLLHEMAERYHDRIIIFDSSPLLAASEAGILASQVGQIVVVVEAGKTSEAALKDALGRIDSSKVAGLLLNKGESPSLGYGYGGYG
jgi:exopolysaccharide/PEP-CTERM locus tyrosine autokinase